LSADDADFKKTYKKVDISSNANELKIVTSLGGIPLTLPSPAEGRG
jgi:hypothetical protein